MVVMFCISSFDTKVFSEYIFMDNLITRCYNFGVLEDMLDCESVKEMEKLLIRDKKKIKTNY